MSRLYDFKCDTCDGVVEKLIDGDEREVPCSRVACGGTARRQIGGGPVPRSAGGSRLPPGTIHLAHVHAGAFCVDVVLRPPPPKAKA